MTLWEQLIENEYGANTVWEWDGAEFREGSWRRLVEAARGIAASLRKRGVGRGSIVPAVLTNGPDVTPAFMGIWMAGGTIASLPIIARGMSVETYMQQLTSCCHALGAEWLLAEERFLDFMPRDGGLGVEVVGYGSLLGASPIDPEPPALDKTIFIQFSSGTTGEPHGVELSGAAIEAQLQLLTSHLAIDPESDVGCMWLPQSHDMGFFGCTLLAWYSGIRGVKSTPERFLASPRDWLDDCARFGATVTAGPPFAVAVATRAERIRPSPEPLKLRLCLVGAEDVPWNVLTDAVEAFGPRGLALETFTPAYGLAEATLAVTAYRVEDPPQSLHVDVAALESGEIVTTAPFAPNSRTLVSAGRPLAGTVVQIDAASGEVLVASPSLANGYFGDDAATKERFQNGAFSTSDLGFIRDQHLYVCGRCDDVLIVGGRNVYAHQLETIVGADAGIRRGNCALVTALDDPQRIAAVVEAASNDVDRGSIARRLQQTTREASGLSLDEVVFLPKGAFPKTPSGKTQRYRCRQIVREALDSERIVMRGGHRRGQHNTRTEAERVEPR
jgi:acyl-CoA synthetase (AMP-forming)/AMP-acid ligase II